MKKTLTLCALLVSIAGINTTSAATLIQSSNAHRSITNIYIDGNRARIERPHHKGFILIDVGKKTMKAIMHHQRSVYDMSEFMQESYSPPPGQYVDTYTKTIGLGPEISGFETEEYALYANDKYCGSIYVSLEAFREIGLRKFAHAFVQINSNIDAHIAKLTGATSNQVTAPCTKAERKAGLQLRDVGFPLKYTDENRRMTSVTTRIQKGAQLPANAFVIPASYKVVKGSTVVNRKAKHTQGMTPEMRREIFRQQQLQHNQQNQSNQHNDYYPQNEHHQDGQYDVR
ncbi:hypothetical protein MNBD_GAMMA09-2349 [hydrothermal vent metagenome]|uniref:DUF4412 domain-containing protein n=1 Tax=hydrothermal vent metagenome TaxID=652676 RepID=A0A3B0YGP2_9ZZZZ